jgi:hypothetical protein
MYVIEGPIVMWTATSNHPTSGSTGPIGVKFCHYVADDRRDARQRRRADSAHAKFRTARV